MFKHILFASFRNFANNKLFSVINVSGLSAGLTAFALIVLYSNFELTYDNFHHDAERIHRVVTKVTLQDEVINHESSTYGGIINSLREDPDVEDLTVISAFDSDGSLLRIRDPEGNRVALTSYKGLYADESFFDVFTFPLTTVDKKSALKDPYSAVISKTFSTRFKGNPIGQIIEFVDDENDPKLLTITAVMEDVPDNSHLRFDIVINLPAAEVKFWDWEGHAYLRLKNRTNVGKIERRLDALAIAKNGLKVDDDDYGQISTFKLQTLKDIHLHSDLEYEFEAGGNSLLVYSLLIISFLVLAVAWVNYINLYTAMALQKIRQVGIRKIIGATKVSLTFQIFADSAILNSFSLALTAIGVSALLPFFCTLTGIPQGAIGLAHPVLWITASGFLVVSTLVSGFYPAGVLTSLNPLKAIKGRIGITNSFNVQRYLVVFQFTIAIVLITTTFVVNRQLNFMQEEDLGIDIDKVLVIKAMNFHHETWSDSAGGYRVDVAYRRKAEVFRNELLTRENIRSITSLSHLPGQIPNWGTEFKVQDDDPQKAYNLKAIGVDYDFIETLGMTLAAGRSFSPDYTSDRGNENKRAIVINETTSRLLGFRNPKDAVSRHVTTYWGADYEIIGVVNSFHQVSLKDELTPLYFILQPRALSHFAINLKRIKGQETIREIKDVWARHFPDYPFEYIFLNEYFNRQYEGDLKFANTTGIFTFLAVLIGCMGLFGLTSYAIVQRSKEIGIRKVLGASAANVTALFAGNFLRLVLVASSVAIPVTYYGITKWLDHYAFKISLEWWMFLLPAMVVMGIIFSTVSLQTVKVASKNPAESLKSD